MAKSLAISTADLVTLITSLASGVLTNNVVAQDVVDIIETVTENDVGDYFTISAEDILDPGSINKVSSVVLRDLLNSKANEGFEWLEIIHTSQFGFIIVLKNRGVS